MLFRAHLLSPGASARLLDACGFSGSNDEVLFAAGGSPVAAGICRGSAATLAFSAETAGC